MAKGQITEKDLELGVKTAGGFSGLSKVTRRDSPFGVEHAKSTVEEKEKTVEVKVETPKESIEVKKVSVRTIASKEKESKTKAEIFSEKITLNISPEMRDKAEMLARSLQRKKADKSERITANTIYRVAIKAMLENEKFIDDHSPNTEKEMLELVKGKKL
jgi:hypothetical protein